MSFVLTAGDPGGNYGFIELPKALVCNDLSGKVPKVITTKTGATLLKFKVAAEDLFGSNKRAVFDCEITNQDIVKYVQKWIIPGTRVLIKGVLRTYDQNQKGVIGIVKVNTFLRMDIEPRDHKTKE